MRRRNAFTLAEALVAISIAIVLMAVLSSVGSRAVYAAKVNNSAGNLHQIDIAFQIYRADYEGAQVGSPSEMGFPSVETLARLGKSALVPEERVWHSPCGTHPDSPSLPVGNLVYRLYEDWEGWATYVRAYGDQAIYLADLNCNPHDTRLYTPLMTKHIIGVTVGGNIRRHKKKGSLSNENFFE